MKKRKMIKLADRRVQEDSMDCPFCTDRREIPVDPDWIQQHLIVVLDKSFHYHVHGPIGDKEAMKLFILKIAEEAGIEIEDEEGGSGKKDKTNKEREKRDEPQIIETKILPKKKKKTRPA